jgi:hypothetical protein
VQRVRSSDLSKTDARTPQIPIDRVGETEPLPARDFVPWRFSDASWEREDGFVMQASEKPAQKQNWSTQWPSGYKPSIEVPKGYGTYVVTCEFPASRARVP